VWELASRTVQDLARNHPRVSAIWGFSNTSFFHVKVPELPPGTAGQSYHPYGTGRLCYADAIKGKEQLLLDPVVPSGCIAQPEGWAHSWYQTESLVRLIAPAARSARPPESPAFAHFITEHGFRADAVGLSDPRDAERAKAKFLLRATLLWLNKGIRALYVYDAYDADPLGFGVLAADGEPGAGLRALHNAADRLRAATPISRPRSLDVEVSTPAPPSEETPTSASWADGARAGGLDELVAVLPFQVTDRSFALAAYVMTQDFPADLPPRPYTIGISGVRGLAAAVTGYAPETGAAVPVRVVSRAEQRVAVAVSLTDVPVLIEVDDGAVR